MIFVSSWLDSNLSLSVIFFNFAVFQDLQIVLHFVSVIFLVLLEISGVDPIRIFGGNFIFLSCSNHAVFWNFAIRVMRQPLCLKKTVRLELTIFNTSLCIAEAILQLSAFTRSCLFQKPDSFRLVSNVSGNFFLLTKEVIMWKTFFQGRSLHTRHRQGISHQVSVSTYGYVP